MMRLKLDGFTGLLLLTVALASLLPCRGSAASAFAVVTKAAIILLFFMHGAKLSRDAVLAGLGAWRLHLLVLGATFGLFPLLGLGIARIPASLLDPDIAQGIVFLSILPSTVQSSIALTAIAGGNVAAAVCSASLSNILGVVVTPAFAAILLPHTTGAGQGGFLAAVTDIATTLLLPFLAGHMSRRWTAHFVHRHKALLMRLDRGSILLVVYTAFSAAVVEGLWQRITAADLAAILVVDALLLAVVLLVTTRVARLFGFARADEIVVVFCGSKKSLASGVPMAAALFPVSLVGTMVLPLMFFHQLQLLVCAVLARRYAERPAEGATAGAQVPEAA
ncbi:bile acid:sodium symporter family protein [Novosphingobium naphthalenivorans]|uniref:bile acid:sodium symporter family protein n=1 Tax=Novosphingobium naphthalenivorans TaxID=273168 RepID=UPI00083779AF|nr:bile acid:sodium symporter family protein [Novosphingobium naphthalenivorans]